MNILYASVGLAVILFVTHLSSGLSISTTENVSTIAPEENEESTDLIFVKLGIAVAMFVCVIVACGLPIVILDCLQKRVQTEEVTDDNNRQFSTVKSNVNNAEASTSNHSSGNMETQNSNCIESARFLLSNGEFFTESPPTTPEARANNVWNENNAAGASDPVNIGVRRHQMVHKQRLIKLWASRITCFAAGIFLTTGFMDLFPDVEEAVHLALLRLNIESSYPFASLFTLLGFFMVLIVEQLVLTYQSYHKQRNINTQVAVYRKNVIEKNASSNYDTEIRHGESSHSHIVDSHTSGSMMRALLLLVALSIHSVFEGLAVGLQRTVSKVVALFTAILLHKLIMAASIGVNLAISRQQSDRNTISRRTIRIQVFSTVLFALASPIGLMIGCGLIAQHDSGVLNMSIAVLQGLACGTFFYVVFCEILPHELKEEARDRLGKLFSLVLGFTMVSVYVYFES